MDLNQVQPQLKQFLEAVSKSIKVDQMLIFGSYREGTARPESDIDVIVVSENFREIDNFDRLAVLDRAARFIRPEIQAWGFTSEELKTAEELTLLGQVRLSGARFV